MCAVWLVEQMRSRPTDQTTDRRMDKASYCRALAHVKEQAQNRAKVADCWAGAVLQYYKTNVKQYSTPT